MRSGILIPVFLLLTSVAQGQTPAKVTYDEHVLPMLREKCLSCHGQDKKSGGLSLHTFARLMEGGSSGVIVKPGDPDGSTLFGVVAHKVEPYMPPRSPMLAKEADLLRRWIEMGALENSGSKVVINKPKVDIGLGTVVRGKPEGPPPMPANPLPLDPFVRLPRPNAVLAMATSPWAPLIAIGGPKQVFLYHTETLDLLGVLPFPEGQVQVLKFSRNGTLLLAAGGRGGKSGKAVVWSVKTGQRITEVGDETDSILAADISPDQTAIAVGGPGKIVRIYATADGKMLHEIRKHTDWVTAIEYSPDGVLLASGDRSSGLQVWESYTAREYFSLRGHTSAITEVSWRPDGNLLASTSEDGSVRLWEMENGTQVKTWNAHPGGSLSVKFGKDGRLVSAGRDKLVKLWDGNGTLVRAFEALPDVVLRTTLNQDGSRVIGGDWSGMVPVWTTGDGKRVGQLSVNPEPLAERIENISKALVAAQSNQEKLVAAVATAQTAGMTASNELARLQKASSDAALEIKVANDNIAKAQGAVNQARAALAQASANVRSREILAQVWQEAAAKVKDSASKAKDDAALQAALTRANEVATMGSTELTQARKVADEKNQALKAAEAIIPPLQQVVARTSATIASAPKLIEAQDKAVKLAQANLATAQASMAAGAANLNQLRTSLDRLKLAQVNKTAQAIK